MRTIEWYYFKKGWEDNEPTKNKLSNPYEVNYYVDTISGYVILTTVCHNHYNTSLSANSIILGEVDKTDFKK